MNKQLIFIYEPNGLMNARMKLSRHRRENIREDSFQYFSLEDFDGRTMTPQLVILEDEAVYQMELVAAAMEIAEINSILVCDNLNVLSGLIDKITTDPLIVTLDYKIGSNNSPENLPAIYNRLRARFKTTAVIGYTNFGRKKTDKEFSARSADDLTDLIRSNNDAVIEKTGMTTKALSSILYDRMQVQIMRKELVYLTVENTQLKKENARQEELYADKIEAYKESATMRNLERPLIGNSPAMKKIKYYTETYADSDLEVLLLGESGTGKELVARALHRLSPRCRYNFVPVDCGAFNSDTASSDLFGHEEGAFTGAIKQHIGFIEQAQKGTLFLDEIGNLPYDMQAKLMRVLAEKEVVRMSGKRLPVDFRLVCATNKDLKQMVADGKFHADLLERIEGYFPPMPALRERKEDISMLIQYFCKKNNCKFKISDQAIAYLVECPWTGNIRSLERFIKNLQLFHKDTTVDFSDVKKMIESKLDQPKEQHIDYLSEAEQFLEKINTILGNNTKYIGSKKVNLDALAAELHISRMSFFEQRKKYTPAMLKLMNDFPKRWPSIRNKTIKLVMASDH